MEGSFLQSLGKTVVLTSLGCMFVDCLPIEWTRGYKLFLGAIMFYIMRFLLELIRAKIQKSLHQTEEYVSYANIIRLFQIHVFRIYIIYMHIFCLNPVTGS